MKYLRALFATMLLAGVALFAHAQSSPSPDTLAGEERGTYIRE